MWKCSLTLVVALFVHGEGQEPKAGAQEGTCTCVPYYQCPEGYYDSNPLVFSIDRKCESYLEVCCTSPTNKIPGMAKTRCGRRNPDGVGSHTAGGRDDEAQFGEFPWMVAVMGVNITDSQEGIKVSAQAKTVHHCGGSLIHPRVVLTGAHCVAGREANQLKIRAGDWDTRTKVKAPNFQERDVDLIVVHEEFNGGNLFNDVAILILSDPVDSAENIGFACVPTQGYITTPGTRCLATGWGKDVDSTESQPPGFLPTLKKIDVPVVSNPDCQNLLRSTILGRHFVLNKSFICAGGEQDKDTCKGDGGSPLVCPLSNNPEIYVQSGIVAWGIGCGKKEIPGVYANVALFRNWIDKQMRQAQLDTSYYTH